VSGHKIHARLWMVAVAIAVLIAAHAALFGLMLRGHLSLWLIAAVVGALRLKYAWWRMRR
jgi:hypothetical protein